MPEHAPVAAPPSKWPAYDAALKQRGNLTVWFSEDVVDAWVAPKEHQPGHPRLYADLAIEVALTVRAVYQLALRQAEGFLQSIVEIMGLVLSIPDHTTMSRRCKKLKIRAILRNSSGPIDMAVDSTGLKIYVGRQRRRFLRGAAARRPWRKLHLAVDLTTGEIVASTITSNTKGDAARVPGLVAQVNEPIGTFFADGAYDRRSVYATLSQRQPTPEIRVVIPPRKDAKLSRKAAVEPTQRDLHLLVIKHGGRKAWEKAVGYGRRSVVENAIYRFKTVIGRSLRGRLMETQDTETRVGCKILNIMKRLRPMTDAKAA